MIITRIPLPPSVNGLYASVRGRQIKSQEGRIYDQKIEMFKLRNFRTLQEITKLYEGKLLKVDRYFVLEKKRVFCKDGSIKKLDCTNFIKACDDGLARLIMIDDKYFKSGNCELVWCEKQTDEQVIIKITEHKMIMLDELKGKL